MFFFLAPFSVAGLQLRFRYRSTCTDTFFFYSLSDGPELVQRCNKRTPCNPSAPGKSTAA